MTIQVLKNLSKNVIAIMCMASSTGYLYAAPAEEKLVEPVHILRDQSISNAQNDVQTLAARRYYTFWHTGNADFARAALANNFKDLNLPQGRQQGPDGPLQASQHFRAAVPDLKVEVVEMMIVSDRVIGRLHFTGHFTGKFMGQQGDGQKVNFSAVDIYRIADGKIIENWHLEDNFTLLQQIGAVTIKK